MLKESDNLQIFSTEVVKFSADVYKELLKSNSENFLVCLLSTEIILALSHAGAAGRTAQQIATALHLPENSETIQQIFKLLTESLGNTNNKDYSLYAANKIYVNAGFKINDQFANTAVNSFGAEIQNITFANKEKSAAEINRWVEEKTIGKIQNLIKTNDVDKDTFSIMINTIYFKGKWVNPFEDGLTEKRPFYVNDEKFVEVDMMERDTDFNYYKSQDLDAQFLVLPYEGGDVAMTIVLPNKIEGLSNLEARIADVFIKPNYVSRRLQVNIPKFKIETSIQFKPILQALGIVDAFQDCADFSGTLVGKNMKISKVIQKTFIEVNEEGTEASAGTGAFMTFRSIPRRFVADHPFIFYIKYKDILVFAGRYTTPDSVR